MAIDLDADLNNADWTKALWDLPYNDVKSLREWLAKIDMSVESFKQLPVYKANVDKLEWLKEL